MLHIKVIPIKVKRENVLVRQIENYVSKISIDYISIKVNDNAAEKSLLVS